MNDHADDPLEREWVARIPYRFARRHGVICVGLVADEVVIWQRAPAPAPVVSEIERVLRRPLRLKTVGEERFAAALGTGYARDRAHAQKIMGDLDDTLDLAWLASQLPKTEDVLEGEGDAPVVRLINALLAQAVREQASDIHVEPFEGRSLVRFRIDGVLRDVIEPQKAAHAILASRIKVMARLDIAEKRLPQDGRMTLQVAGRTVDVRVSTIPAAHGERVVMRLLDKHADRLNVRALGMADDTLAALQALVRRPHGVLLVTGPTGSGKTTTLYALLRELDVRGANIMTVEDPIEYHLDGVGQIQVNPRIELTFARVLRAILRQDPDIVMIGEIRDLETAQIAVQAGLTGHLVLATLHTHDAVGAVTRLVDMGIEPFLVATVLIGVLAQRLVRTVCGLCRGHAQARPCPACGATGLCGRTGLYELFIVTDPVRALIHDRAPEARVRALALECGLRSLHQDGLRAAALGRTTLDEVARVSRD
ncbi:ATPase, T2SS/T4P/T4SS family [Acidiferrobacter sp.]|uniref:GspE/PulE family protein n=1 Tax=Acidiferrobacter sp. TaxID=1872107 RepID=UPI00260FB360|nr:ATPase, T2SS/T4P/T4SS family [Acidiferrobacter sp.]